jgi:hypothetical protein
MVLGGTNGSAIFGNSTGKITISGSTLITSTNTAAKEGTIFLANSSTQTAERLVIIGATVRNAAEGNAICNASTGAINIRGGTVVAGTTGAAIYSNSAGAISISGGIVKAIDGAAIFSDSTGKITISGNAHITSANTNSVSGTVHLAEITAQTVERLAITGATIENTSKKGNGVFNESAGTISIGGGKILAKDGFALHNEGAATVTITNGILFAFGTGIDDIIFGAHTATSGDFCFVAWNNDADKIEYRAGIFDDLFVHGLPSATASAKWNNVNGIAGIDCKSGANTGFIPITEVYVIGSTPISYYKKSDGKHGILLKSNIVSENVQMRIILPNSDKVCETKIIIYDNIGNVVFNETKNSTDVYWNLTNAFGRKVFNGSYLITAQIKGVSGKVYLYSSKVGVKK